MTEKQFQGDAAASPWTMRAIVLLLILWVAVLGGGVMLQASEWQPSHWFKVGLLVSPMAILIGCWLMLARKRNQRAK